MRKAFNFILLWLVLFLAFQAFACKSVQKGVQDEAAATVSQTNTTGKAKAGSTETGKKKTGSAETGKKKAGSNETGKSKQGTLVELKKEVVTEAEKILNPTVRKAILPSGVILLILASLMSSKRDDKRRRKNL